MNYWYVASKADAVQGIVAEETTGATIAVTYDAKDVSLVAAAPEMLEALEAIIAYEDDQPARGTFGSEVYAKARFAIAKATGAQ